MAFVDLDQSRRLCTLVPGAQCKKCGGGRALRAGSLYPAEDREQGAELFVLFCLHLAVPTQLLHPGDGEPFADLPARGLLIKGSTIGKEQSSRSLLGTAAAGSRAVLGASYVCIAAVLDGAEAPRVLAGAHLCQDTFTMASPFGTTLHSLSCVFSKPAFLRAPKR